MSAFASRLDTQLRKAKSLGAELLPDEDSVDRHLRLIFWEGLKDIINDKARHRKDSCKTFSDLIAAARYGEKEALPSQATRKVARCIQASDVKEEAASSQEPPARLAQVCAAMAREVREALKSERESDSHPNHQTDQMRQRTQFRGGYRGQHDVPICYRCGQKGHVQKGCRNEPLQTPKGDQHPENERRPLSRGSQRHEAVIRSPNNFSNHRRTPSLAVPMSAKQSSMINHVWLF